ncbi:Leucine Rich Repeat family protein [Caenorhabditis elegans]|uniref:Leucine Rich Repeat family protein n=1 Tax=Caenorhabditis elegans TaxID=6239 RepID=U4PLS1_CAEEL|nr:Leucine Rich Repeat family protein [Caenorhabditis elegans]CDH93033.2 Leucine Rich Repeat family protein [Caenorhabditis elegans]|eukprot:NP_001343700.1 Uncharacterized protein CELE_Y55F3C.9 [Caenorhabditis elegans]
MCCRIFIPNYYSLKQERICPSSSYKNQLSQRYWYNCSHRNCSYYHNFYVTKCFNFCAQREYVPRLIFNRISILIWGSLWIFYPLIHSDKMLLIHSVCLGFIISLYHVSLFIVICDLVGWLCSIFCIFLYLTSTLIGLLFATFIPLIVVHCTKSDSVLFHCGGVIILLAALFNTAIPYWIREQERKEGLLFHFESYYNRSHHMIDSLSNIAAERIAKYMNNGDYIISKAVERMDAQSCEVVFSNLLKLNPSQSGVIAEVCKNRSLHSLILGKKKKILKYGKKIDVVCLIDCIVNENSRTTLKSLDISKSEQILRQGWPEKIADMLPSLTTFILSGKKLTENEMTLLIKSFPNLSCLDISDTNIKNLNGISNLTHLQVLSMRNLHFNTWFDMMDLFNLKNLTFLDVSHDHYNTGIKTMQQFIGCGKSIEKLAFLDCTSTDLNDNLLNSLMESHPNLQKITALNCLVQYSKIPELQVLNMESIGSSLKSLSYFTSLKREASVLRCLTRILFLLRQAHERNEEYDLIGCMMKIIEVIETFPSTSANNLRYSIYMECVNCLTEISGNKSHQFHSLDVSLVLDIFLNYIDKMTSVDSFFGEHPCIPVWTAILNMIDLDLPGLNYDKIGGMAIQFLIKTAVAQNFFQCHALDVFVKCTVKSRNQNFSQYFTGMNQSAYHIFNVLTGVLKGIDIEWCLSAFRVLSRTPLKCKHN